MSVLDLLKLLGGATVVFSVIGGGLFGLSKFRNSRLRKKMDGLVSEVMDKKEEIHELELSSAKDEQKKSDIKEEVMKVDKELQEVDNKKPKQPTNEAVLDMFNKLTKN